MSEPRELPGRIVVVGDGPLGALAALALKRALPPTQVLVLAMPPHPGALSDRIGTALPFSNWLHDRLGIAEDQLVTRAGASHRLVMRYFGGGGPGQQGAAGYGVALDPAMNTAFAREWGGGPRNAGTAAPPESLGDALAAAGRFAPHLDGASSPLGEVDYGLRWHTGAYRDLVIEAAQRAGVQHARGLLRTLQPDGQGGVAALTLEGVGEVAADLFIDCTGPAALLHSQLPEARSLDWEDMLPARAVAFARRGDPMLSLEDRATFTPIGWRWEIAGRDGRQAVLAFPADTPEQAIVEHLGASPAELVAVPPGRTEAAWLGNVIALGEAAARIEPLGGIALDLAHRQLDLLLEMLPGRVIEPSERAEYNRRAAMMADRAADWVAVHYAAPAATAAFPGLARSPELVRALDQFTRRGRTPFTEDAPMLVQEWGTLLRAIGIAPGEDPRAVDEERNGEEASRSFAARAETAVRSTPPYAEWLKQVLSA